MATAHRGLPPPSPHIIDPYNLDDDGYDIANHDFIRLSSSQYDIPYDLPRNYTSHSGNPIFNVTFKNFNYTSNELIP